MQRLLINVKLFFMLVVNMALLLKIRVTPVEFAFLPMVSE